MCSTAWAGSVSCCCSAGGEQIPAAPSLPALLQQLEMAAPSSLRMARPCVDRPPCCYVSLFPTSIRTFAASRTLLPAHPESYLREMLWLCFHCSSEGQPAFTLRNQSTDSGTCVSILIPSCLSNWVRQEVVIIRNICPAWCLDSSSTNYQLCDTGSIPCHPWVLFPPLCLESCVKSLARAR